jgi:hypothetical protein
LNVTELLPNADDAGKGDPNALGVAEAEPNREGSPGLLADVAPSEGDDDACVTALPDERRNALCVECANARAGDAVGERLRRAVDTTCLDLLLSSFSSSSSLSFVFSLLLMFSSSPSSSFSLPFPSLSVPSLAVPSLCFGTASRKPRSLKGLRTGL